ncbi:MAG: hypothetical protein JO151_18260 [Verrucomicrobia bacterium]|nr:hypothetical protein [Verrucomicrobiota bacterium]
MLFNMIFGRFSRMVISMYTVTVRDVGMMGRLLVATATIMLGRLPVMSGCMFVMLCCFRVMFCALLAHWDLSRVWIAGRGTIPPAANVYNHGLGLIKAFRLHELAILILFRSSFWPGKKSNSLILQ